MKIFDNFNQNRYKSRHVMMHRYRFKIMGTICNKILQLKCLHFSFFYFLYLRDSFMKRLGQKRAGEVEFCRKLPQSSSKGLILETIKTCYVTDIFMRTTIGYLKIFWIHGCFDFFCFFWSVFCTQVFIFFKVPLIE